MHKILIRVNSLENLIETMAKGVERSVYKWVTIFKNICKYNNIGVY